MDISHQKRPDVNHVFKMKWMQQEMTGSRSFLLVLLLATVTCILLIQMSMDNWIHPRNIGFYNFTVTSVEKKKNEKHPVVLKPELEKTSTPFVPTSPTALVTILRVVTSIRSVTSPPENRIFQPIPIQSKLISEKKKNASLFLNQKRLFLNNHQANLQDIIKRKNALRRFRPDPMKRVNLMPIIHPEKVNRIILLTYFRTGSSFIGELLQQNSKTFYQYEPLHYMTYGTRISSANQTEEALKLLNSIYRCNFSNLENYFDWVSKPKNRFLFSRSLFLWFTCRINPAACFKPDFVSEVCKRAPVQVVKTTRLNMWQLKLFLEMNPDLNIKVVYLTRDPRGVISSRWTLADWCNGTECSNPDTICSEMRNDISIFNELRNKEPSKFIKIRYEDMAVNPEIEAKNLFEFLNLSFTQSVRSFLKSHTTAKRSDNLDPYSTKRNSASMAYSWHKRVNFQQVETIQKSCSDIISHLNYTLLNNSVELNKAKFENQQLSDNLQDRLKFAQHAFLPMRFHHLNSSLYRRLDGVLVLNEPNPRRTNALINSPSFKSFERNL